MANQNSAGSAEHDLPFSDQIRASEIRELSSTAGTEVAEGELQGMRDKVQTVTEGEEVPTYNEAKEAYGAVEKGDHGQLERLNQKFCNKQTRFAQRQPKAKDGGPGWHCVPHRRTTLNPVEQSIGLAALINSKIDPAKMKSEAEARRAEKDARNAKKGKKVKRAPKKEAALEFTNEDILSAIPLARSLNELGKVLTHCENTGKCFVESDENGDTIILPIGGVEGSEEIVEALNNQYDAIDEKRREKAERAKEKELARHVEWAIGKMEEANSTPHLEKIIKRELGHMVFIRKGRGRYDWTVHVIKGKPIAYESVALEADRILDALEEKARQRQARDGIESLLRRVR